MIPASWTVIENTPGYLPEDDDPPVFETYTEAVAYMNQRAQEYVDDPDVKYEADYGWAGEGNYACVQITEPGREHDLGRFISVVAVEEDDELYVGTRVAIRTVGGAFSLQATHQIIDQDSDGYYVICPIDRLGDIKPGQRTVPVSRIKADGLIARSDS